MSQTVNKYLGDNSVDGRAFRLGNSQILRARNQLGTADVPILQVDGNNYLKMLTQIKADDALPLPAAAKDYVTVEWVENYFTGKQDPKEAVDALVDFNITLTGTHPLVADGYSFADGDYAGVIGQTDKTENGAYLYTVSGGNYTLTRRFDFNEDREVSKGAYFPVTDGTEYAGYTVILVTEGPISLGTTELEFVAYASALSIKAGDMLIKAGNSLSVNLAPLSGLESTNPGQPGGQLRIKTDTASLEKDRTTRRDPTTGALVAKRSRKFPVQLSPTDIANGYIDIGCVAEQDSVELMPAGAPSQLEDIDFSVNYTGGSGGNTRITFLNGLAAGGVSALVSGENITIRCRSF